MTVRDFNVANFTRRTERLDCFIFRHAVFPFIRMIRDPSSYFGLRVLSLYRMTVERATFSFRAISAHVQPEAMRF